MKHAFIFAILLGLTLCANGRSYRKTISRWNRYSKPTKRPVTKPSCISKENDRMNHRLQSFIEHELKLTKLHNVTSERLEAVLMKSLHLCPLAEAAKVGVKYKGFFPGVKAFRYKFKNWRWQTSKEKYREFEKKYGSKILKYRPLPIFSAGFAVLTFGCDWDTYEVNCIFVTEDFFRFIVLISESVKPMHLQELIPFLKKPELFDLSLFIRCKEQIEEGFKVDKGDCDQPVLYVQISCCSKEETLKREL